MSLPSSGLIDLKSIQTEFGGTTPAKIDNYYRDGSFVKSSTRNKNVPKAGKISLADFYSARVGWTVGPVTVSTTGVTDVALPKEGTEFPSSFLITHYGAWGQTKEVGEVSVLNSASTIIAKFRESTTLLIPAGYKAYSVDANNVETEITDFPKQSGSLHNVYIEFIDVQSQNAYMRSDGAPGASSNPTSFRNIKATTDYDRAAVLAAKGSYDVFYSVHKYFPFSKVISANALDLNIETLAREAGWDGVQTIEATITVNAGVYVSSSSTSKAAITVGNIPLGSAIIIINNGTIVGKGGDGGQGGSKTIGLAGSSGGPGINVTGYKTKITNNGIIAGGGGGGSGGNSWYNSSTGVWVGGSGGGGGRSYVPGAGGLKGTGTTGTPYDGSAGSVTSGGNGGNSTTSYGLGGTTAAGGAGTPYTSVSVQNSPGGGGGGGFGSAGGAGGLGYSLTTARVGGAAGNSVLGNSMITWAVAGTVYGTKA